MMVPDVLSLGLDEARARLAAAGYIDIEILISGRRREGGPRIIRQKTLEGKIELVVSYFKELTQ
jgi:hypothetical protein